MIGLARPAPGARDMGARRRPEIGAERGGDPLGETGGNLVLGHERPVFDPRAINEVDRVLVAAEGVHVEVERDV